MRKIKVVLIMFMCVMQLAGCQQEIESQIFESEEIQSEEVQSTVEDVIEELTRI